MKKNIFKVLCLLLVFVGVGLGSWHVKQALRSEAEKLQDKIIALDKEVEDLDSRYWADRVLHKQDVTLEELKEFSKGWLGNGARQYRLIAKQVQSGQVKPLTPEENRRLLEHHARVRDLLNPDKMDMNLVATLTQAECAQLRARYWANRVQQDRAHGDNWYQPGWEDILVPPAAYYTLAGDRVMELERNIKRGEKTRQLFLDYLNGKEPFEPLNAFQAKRERACRYFDEQVASVTRYPTYRYTGEE